MNRLIALLFLFAVIFFIPITTNAATQRTEPLNFFINDIRESIDSLATEGWAWNAETQTLMLHGLNMNFSGEGNGINLPPGSTIMLAGQNKIVNDDADEFVSGIACWTGGITIVGNGTLEIVISSIIGNAIYAHDVTINGGSLILESGTGISAINDATINGGEIEFDAYTGIRADNISIGGGKIIFTYAIDGIRATNNISISGGEIFADTVQNGIRANNLRVHADEIHEIYTGQPILNTMLNGNPITVQVEGRYFGASTTVHTIIFDMNDELISGSYEEAVTVGAVIVHPPETRVLNHEIENGIFTQDLVVFDEWCLDPEFTIPFDFNTPITSDITLYSRQSQTIHNIMGSDEEDWIMFVLPAEEYETELTAQPPAMSEELPVEEPPFEELIYVELPYEEQYVEELSESKKSYGILVAAGMVLVIIIVFAFYFLKRKNVKESKKQWEEERWKNPENRQ
ncbi:MAG: hypothetical protein LBI27_09925 [Clostridiales bacterium]|nr:hypothetical protein [Clostridiales bacterium]